MKFENPTMTISMFEVENVVTTVSAVNNVDEAVNEFIDINGGAAGTGYKMVF